MAGPRVLIIAGLDPSGGAGLAADIRTISALGGHPMPILSAVTVQNTCGVEAVHPLEPALVAAQIRAVCEDIAPDAVKIGMLADPAVVEVVAEALAPLAGVPIVVDPVLAAGTGDSLATAPLVPALVTHLLPLAGVVTPNAPELAALTGRPVTTEAELEAAARILLARTGAAAVYAKAGHLSGPVHRDLFMTRDGRRTVHEAPHVTTRAGHGTGCVLASALAWGLGAGLTPEEAARRAHAFVQEALRHADLSLGRGTPPVNPLWG
ncbi:MAG: bifunctional hydroxymethylpyrimidine kinase/phosphomethylpyrimidine kinase, partial [Alphaproteobacteria bacterium]